MKHILNIVPKNLARLVKTLLNFKVVRAIHNDTLSGGLSIAVVLNRGAVR